MTGLRTAVAFLTPLPVGAAAPDRRTPRWFPVVGAGLGGVVALAWWAAGEAFPPLVAGVLVVALDLVLTGALHLDGLADAADGLLAHRGLDRRARRRIMAAPDVGAFGVATVAVVLLLRVAAFASLEHDPWLVAALWSASRAAMAVALARVRYVGGGLGAAFVGGGIAGPRPVGALAAALLVPVALALPADDAAVALVAVAGGWAAAAGVVAVARRRLGGVTGDVLGAAGVLVETAGLVLASARW